MLLRRYRRPVTDRSELTDLGEAFDTSVPAEDEADLPEAAAPQ